MLRGVCICWCVIKVLLKYPCAEYLANNSFIVGGVLFILVTFSFVLYIYRVISSKNIYLGVNNVKNWGISWS